MLQRNSREGLMYLESQAHPFGFVDSEGKPVPLDVGAIAFRHVLAKPEVKRLNIDVRLLVTGIRFAPDAEEHVASVYEFVDHHRDLWVGVNLAGGENSGKGQPLRFLKTFRKLRRQCAGIHLSIHGGDHRPRWNAAHA